MAASTSHRSPPPVDLRWPRIRALDEAMHATEPHFETEDHFLHANAEIREEYLRSGHASFQHVAANEYKVRLSWPVRSDAVGGITWRVPRSLASCVHEVYIVWLHDIIDHLKQVGTSAEDWVLFRSQEFPPGRPFITTPFVRDIRKTSSSSSTTTSYPGMSSSAEEQILYMIVQFKPDLFDPYVWTPQLVKSQTLITGCVVTGLNVPVWMKEAYKQQQARLMRNHHDDTMPMAMALQDSTRACTRNKHSLVWPLYSLGDDARLCCEKSEKTHARFRWAKCPHRTRTSFRFSRALQSIVQLPKQHEGPTLESVHATANRN